MFRDERAPAPLDRPLDLDRRWRGRPEPGAPSVPGPNPAGSADGELAVRTPPPWWASGVVAAGPDAPVAAVDVTPIAVLLTPVPSAAPAPPQQLPLPVVSATPPATPSRRLLAAAIDVALVTGAGAVPILLAVHPAPSAGAALAACAAFLALLAFTYATLGHALMGATIGKRVLGLRVEGPDGAAPGLSRSVARSALTVVGAALLGAGMLVGLLGRRGQALHDRVVGTSVVRSPVLRG